MAANRITLKVEPAKPGEPAVRLTDFLFEMAALRNVLAKTEAAMGGHAVLDWRIVAVSLNSPLNMAIEAFTPDAEPAVEAGAGVINRVFEYMRVLDRGGAVPQELDRAALIAFQEFSGPVSSDKLRVEILNGRQAVEVSRTLNARLATILAPRAKMTGTIEGRLEFLNIHGPQSVFRIYPIAGPAKVACHFPRERLAEAREAVGREVRVSGEMTYLERDRFPSSMLVEDMQILPDEAELPDLIDLLGMAPHATGSRSTEEFLSELRRGQEADRLL